MKKRGVFAHLFSYMGRFKITMVLSIILAAVAAVLNLSAFVCVYNVGKEIVQSLGDFGIIWNVWIFTALFPYYSV